MQKFLLFNTSLAMMIFAFGCAKNKPLPGAYERIIGNQEGTVANRMLTLPAGSEKYYSKKVNTNESTELLLGNYDRYKSGVYLQFSPPGDSLYITAADLALIVKGRSAPGDTTFWNTSHQAAVEVFLADTSWDYENPPAKDYNYRLSSTVIYSDSLSSISIPLDTLLLNQWNDSTSTIKSYGFWLESADAEFMQLYYSLDTYDEAVIPRVHLYYSYKDDQGVIQDTNKVIYVNEDAFALLNSEQDLNLDPNQLYIGQGLAFDNIFKFDLSFFDSTIHINRAKLDFTINQRQSIRELTGIDDAIIYRISEEWIEGTISDEQVGASYQATITDSSISFDIGPTVQAMVDNQYPNYGFLLKTQNEDQTISRIAFYSSTSDSLLQPKLKIYYTSPAKQHF